MPQARTAVVERLGRYQRTLDPGLAVLRPFVDRLKPLIDVRDQVVSFAPQPVITEDNLVVQIDTVVYFQVTDPRAVSYEVANPLQVIEQLIITTLRNVIGGITLEDALTSRDHINGQLRIVLDDATEKWGIRVNRVELKSIDPPDIIQQAMEKQMRAERDRRAVILNAEGVKAGRTLNCSPIITCRCCRASPRRSPQGVSDPVGVLAGFRSFAARPRAGVGSNADPAEPASPPPAGATRNGTEPDVS